MRAPGISQTVSSSHLDCLSAVPAVTLSPRCYYDTATAVTERCLSVSGIIHHFVTIYSPALSLHILSPLHSLIWRPGQRVNTSAYLSQFHQERLWARVDERSGLQRKKWVLCIGGYTLKCHAIPTPTSLWVHILFSPIVEKGLFPSQEAPFDLCETSAFVPPLFEGL